VQRNCDCDSAAGLRASRGVCEKGRSGVSSNTAGFGWHMRPRAHAGVRSVHCDWQDGRPLIVLLLIVIVVACCTSGNRSGGRMGATSVGFHCGGGNGCNTAVGGAATGAAPTCS